MVLVFLKGTGVEVLRFRAGPEWRARKAGSTDLVYGTLPVRQKGCSADYVRPEMTAIVEPSRLVCGRARAGEVRSTRARISTHEAVPGTSFELRKVIMGYRTG
jgi:hypothetical protein